MPTSFGTSSVRWFNLPQTVPHIWQKAFFKHVLVFSLPRAFSEKYQKAFQSVLPALFISCYNTWQGKISPTEHVKQPRRSPLRLRFWHTLSKKYPMRSVPVIAAQFLTTKIRHKKLRQESVLCLYFSLRGGIFLDLMTRMSLTLAYVEENLTGEIDPEKLAQIAGCSAYNYP